MSYGAPQLGNALPGKGNIPMSTKYVIIVTGENDDNCETPKLVDDIREAEYIIAAYLEKGFTRESVRLLAGNDIPFVVTNKPVVSAFDGHSEDATDREDQVPAVSSELLCDAAPGDGYIRPRGVWEPVGASAEEAPYMKDGMRFSTAFARP